MTFFKSLTVRPFALLWSGQQLSALGDSIYRVALAWWVLEKTGSAKAMSTIFIFASTPMLVFLLVGGLGPNQGGGIVAYNTSLSDLQDRVNSDPFVAQAVVSAEIIEITPSRADERLKFVVDS